MAYPSSTGDQLFALAVFAFIAVIAVVSLGGYLREWRLHAAADRSAGAALLGPGIRNWYFATLEPLEEFCVRWGVRPAWLSYTQLAGSLLVAGCYAGGLLFTGSWILLFTGTLDIIDGRVARRTHSGSARGAFLDSIVDRYADSLAYLGLAAFFRGTWVLWAVLLALIGGLIVSYARARGEGLGVQCRIGFLQRPERYVILAFGIIFGTLCEHVTGAWFGLHDALVVITVLCLAALVNVTALQRVVFIWRALGERVHA